MGTLSEVRPGILYVGSVRRWLKRLPDRIGFLILTLILRPSIVKFFIDVEKLFVVYPEKERYADAFTFKWMRDRWMKSNPWIGGIYREQGKWGIMAVINIYPHEFKDEHRMTLIYENIKILQERLGAKNNTLSGVMPARMKTLGIRQESPETRLAAVSVVKAVKQLRTDHLVVLLGGKGHTGCSVNHELLRNGIPTVVVDLPEDGGKVNHKAWPELKGSPFLLLNLISGKDLQHYLPLMREGDLILNEAYPAPCKEVAGRFKEKGIDGYHIAGVLPDFCVPSFPGEYAGAVPCCGMLTEDAPIVLRDLLR